MSYQKTVFIIQKKKEFGTENLELITRKGVYLYDYMDVFNKFKEDGLPSIKKYILN